MEQAPKEFRIFNSKTKRLRYYDWQDIAQGGIEFDFYTDENGLCVTEITSFTGRYDNAEVPKPIYAGDIIQIIKTNILVADNNQVGIVEYVPNYSAYGVMFQDAEPKLLHECYENTIIKLSDVFTEAVKSSGKVG